MVEPPSTPKSVAPGTPKSVLVEHRRRLRALDHECEVAPRTPECDLVEHHQVEEYQAMDPPDGDTDLDGSSDGRGFGVGPHDEPEMHERIGAADTKKSEIGICGNSPKK